VDLRALRRRQSQRLRTLADLESKEQREAAAAQAHAALAEDAKLTELLLKASCTISLRPHTLVA